LRGTLLAFAAIAVVGIAVSEAQHQHYCTSCTTRLHGFVLTSSASGLN